MVNPAIYGYWSDFLLWLMLYASVVVHTACFFKYIRPRIGPRVALVIGNGLVFLSLMATLALAAETYHRFFTISTDAFGMSLAAKRWDALYVNLNSNGYRDREWSPRKPPATRRLAFIGDSFTYGWGVESTEDRFTERIADRLRRESESNWEVMNVAKPGWGTDAQLRTLESFITRYDVDEVMLCYVPNDIESVIPRTLDFDPTVPPMPRFFNVRSSALFDYVYWRVYVPYSATVSGYHDWLFSGYSNDAHWQRQEAQLGALIELCDDHGVRLGVALLPFLRAGGEDFDPAAVHSKVGAFFRQRGVPVVDLLEAIDDEDPSDLTVSHMDAHPNARAHGLLAEAIWNALGGAWTDSHRP